MFDSNTSASSLSIQPVRSGRHDAFLKQSFPQWLVDTSVVRKTELKNTTLHIPGWYASATSWEKAQLKLLLEARFTSQNRLDNHLRDLQTAQAFAQPLLEAALNTAGFTLPVNEVHLQLYTPTVDAFGVRSGAYSVRTLSLLQAALHNFEQPEAQANYFAEGSGFITKPDVLGRYQPYGTSLKIETFTQLCRDLDIGAQYQKHLQMYLNPQNPVSQGVLEHRYATQQKAMLNLDAEIALLKGDIEPSSHVLMQRVINGERNIRVGQQQLWYWTPCVMGILLHGCVVFALGVKYRYAGEFIVWIPGDPEHPLKRYATFGAFRDELVGKLTARSTTLRQSGLTPYQKFLSRFIKQTDQPYYYKRLTEHVNDAPDQPKGQRWFRSESTQFWFRALAPQVSLTLVVPPNLVTHKRRVQADHPSIHVNAITLGDEAYWAEMDLWSTLHKELRTQAFANAQVMALPTAMADANNQSLRASHYLNIGLFAVNLVAMVIPPLGEVMLVVMAGQMLYETIEGIHEWSDGDKEAAWAHISDVLENMATVAVGAGVVLAASPIIDGLKRITLPNGTQRLWNVDLRPYERLIDIPPDTKVNELGLHLIEGQKVLSHQNKTYVLEPDPISEQYHAIHGLDPAAYRPEFKSSGYGIWVDEAEQPLTWGRRMLKRRLGPLVKGLRDRDIELMLKVCDVQEGDLRRMYAEGEPMPILLLENLRQLQAYIKTKRVVTEVRAGRISEELCGYVAALTVDMPGWPASKAVEVVDSRARNANSISYGNARATQADVIKISRAELMAGELQGCVVDGLSVPQLEALLGNRMPFDRADRMDMLKDRLGAHIEKNIQRLFNSLREEPVAIADPAHRPVELIKQMFPKLPRAMARRLVAQAGPDEIKQLATGKVPLRLMESARTLQRNTRLSFAYLGLYEDGLVTIDTEVLVLNTLKMLRGWKKNLRLEVRERYFSGQLRASIGELDDIDRKVLVRTSDDKYQAFDDEGNQLHGIDDLYSSLQHALPDDYRKALGVPHVGQGMQLKQGLQRRALSRDQLQKLLKLKTDSRPFFLPPQRLVDGKLGYVLSGRGVFAEDDAQWVAMKVRLGRLFPTYTPDEINAFFKNKDAPTELRLRTLEDEFDAFTTALGNWNYLPIDGRPVSATTTSQERRILGVRRQVRERLENAWRRSGQPHFDRTGQKLGQQLSFPLDGVGPVLQSLPALGADLSHVSKLNLSGLGITDGIDTFLASFKHLRELHITDESLTHLLPAITDMPFLEVLNLKGNAIVLTPESVAQLRALTHMRKLNFEGCPLGLPPDISRMPYLSKLTLTQCKLDRWPTGLFAYPRAREFKLLLDENPLRHIPDVGPGSDKAATVARTSLTLSEVSTEVAERYNLYIESVGLEPLRPIASKFVLDSHPWMSGLSPQQVVHNQALWSSVEAYAGSEPFFNIIRDQARHLDLRTQAFMLDMSDKVWRMLQAISDSPVLRDTLFEMAAAPFLCVDAGAQLFNAMGVEVRVHEIYRGSRIFVGAEIYELARGKVRLDELGAIARARVRVLEAEGRLHPEYDANAKRVLHFDSSGRPVRDIDEVEIYLAYTTELAQRLHLPWQSPDMMFPESDVTPAMIERAYKRVQELEQGGGLFDQLLDQPIWTEYLRGAYAERFKPLREKMIALTDLQVALRDWVEAPGLSKQQGAQLRTTIETAARLLGKSADEVALGSLMSNTVYDADMRALDAEERELMRTLTAQFSTSPLDSLLSDSDSDFGFN